MVDPYGGGRAMVLNAGNRTYETEYELASEFEGDDVGGGNIAYGNAPRTNGARLTKVKSDPGEE